jgi:hypothetical protein
MAKLSATAALEGPQVTIGTVKEAKVKSITPRGKGPEDSFNILEFEFTSLEGPIRDILGSRSLTVGLVCDALNHQTALGILARDVLEWDGETELDTDDFIGADLQFLVEYEETTEAGFWNIDRKSLGPVGHLNDRS